MSANVSNGDRSMGQSLPLNLGSALTTLHIIHPFTLYIACMFYMLCIFCCCVSCLALGYLYCQKGWCKYTLFDYLASLNFFVFLLDFSKLYIYIYILLVSSQLCGTERPGWAVFIMCV